MKHNQRRLAFVLGCLLTALAALSVSAHDGAHASVHDTVAAIIQRIHRQWTDEQLLELTVLKVEAFLTAQEREVLGTAPVRFRVNVLVVVTILRDTGPGDEPFWLRERGFIATGLKVKLSGHEFDAWEKAFAAGEIGLGIHNLTGRGTHYLGLLRPQLSGDKVRVTELYPAHLRTASFVAVSAEGWTAPAEFTTAPAGAAPFSFTYMEDAQNGLDRWGVLLHKAYRSRPDAAFYLLAGDLVDRGAERWDWDSFFENSKDVFDRRQLVPVLGNPEYHVELALQGHDHAYLRTYPMRGQERVASAKDGTIYIISGTKHYEQKPHDYTEVGFTKLSTYQVLDIQINGNRLVYRAHDVDGKVRDEFVTEK